MEHITDLYIFKKVFLHTHYIKKAQVKEIQINIIQKK